MCRQNVSMACPIRSSNSTPELHSGSARSTPRFHFGDIRYEVFRDLNNVDYAGYEWRCKAPSPGLTLLGQDVRPASSMAGAPAEHIFRFRAEAAGKFVLHFIYGRAWEKQPQETKSIDVQVEP